MRKLSQYINNHSIVQKIIEIPIPITDIKDSYYWGLSSTGTFSTKPASGFHMIKNYWRVHSGNSNGFEKLIRCLKLRSSSSKCATMPYLLEGHYLGRDVVLIHNAHYA